MCVRSGGAFNIADLEIGEHVCKSRKSCRELWICWKKKKKVQQIISIVACDVIALRSRRKDFFKASDLLRFFRGAKARVYVSFFFSTWETRHIKGLLF